ncbi:T9SS type A sorting domain-containing protein [Xanthomarina spongicola]|uniref:Putative secreted protein (Por secretion system target) n=1 Tax=Xanthomarina spongicola TaxID=570520 RepID=A0A316DT39_9FLAO|nr:T9SS type A sorting domain-containing protein [Xanthomarina spongicola]PWK19763.1 putative secreted protein (Por secretion system target) [Xanthomarina spongicola]
MMIKKLLPIIILLFVNFIFSQEIEVISGYGNPLGMALKNNDLFICDHGPNSGMGTISKIDILDSNPVNEDILTGLTYPRVICLYNNDLYFSSSGQGLSKININESNPTIQNVASISIIYALIVIDDYLYIGNYQNRIYRINLLSSTVQPEIVLDNIEDRVLAFANKDDDLYFGFSNKVSKINVTDENPVPEEVVTGLESNVYTLEFYNNILLMGMAIADKIAKIDLDADVPEVEDFMTTTIGQPSFLLLIEDDLFIAGGFDGGNIFKVENLSTLLSVENNLPFIIKKIYPNPTSDYLQISGLKENIQYEIYNTNGAKVSTGILEPNSQIDISSLSSGMYNLKLKDGTKEATYFKVIKQ